MDVADRAAFEALDDKRLKLTALKTSLTGTGTVLVGSTNLSEYINIGEVDSMPAVRAAILPFVQAALDAVETEIEALGVTINP